MLGRRVIGIFILIRLFPISISMLVLVITIGVDFPISGLQYVVVGVVTACMLVVCAWICSTRLSMGAGSLVLVYCDFVRCYVSINGFCVCGGVRSSERSEIGMLYLSLAAVPSGSNTNIGACIL